MREGVRIQVNNTVLKGTLTVPKDASGIVLFAHGSGSSRFSPRNIFVAEKLQKKGIGTLLVDLLTKEEDETYENRFDIDLLVFRLNKIIYWLNREPSTQGLGIGLFGASTGAAATLKVATLEGLNIRAIVSRGGRPDLAMKDLGKVVSPTLLIVGGNDSEVINLNKQAFAVIHASKKLEIIPGATHLFEEEGTLEQVAELASDWFQKYF